MSMTFTKLFTSITESSVWFEPDHVRLAWITMLAMADRKGRVFASVPGLAHRARIKIEEAQDSLKCFLGPDRFSRTQDYEGRRIEEIDGGWRLLNYMKFRQVRDEEANKESKRRYINQARSKVEKISTVEQCRLYTSASASASASGVLGEEKGEGGREEGALPAAGIVPAAGSEKPIASNFPPTSDELDLIGAKMGLPPQQVRLFEAFYGSKGWMVGKNRMKSVAHAMSGWKLRWQEDQGPRPHPEMKNAAPVTQIELKELSL